jgi:DNA-binding beta-propeller fold protein YncE
MKTNVLMSASSFLPVFLAAVLLTPTALASDTATKQTVASDAFRIKIDNWVKPQEGWLYVLDPAPDSAQSSGRIWLVDPNTAKVMGSVQTGKNADFALLPDGSRLYVASIMDRDTSELAIIDTERGVVLQRSTIEDREVGNVLPSFSTMAVSGDGLALRILRDTPESETRDMFLLASLNTQTNEFLPNFVRLHNCGPGRFITHDDSTQFHVLCPRSNRIRLIRVDEESRQLENVDVVLPWDRRIGVADAIEVAGSGNIQVIRGDGAIFQMDLATRQFTKTSVHAALPNRIPPAAWPISADGSKIYLGYNNSYDHAYDNRFYLDYGRPPNLRPNDAMAGEFQVFDTGTWKKIGTIKTQMPFWSAALGNDDKTLYAMAPQKHSILVIDTASLHQTRVLKVGGAPSLALIAP